MTVYNYVYAQNYSISGLLSPFLVGGVVVRVGIGERNHLLF